MCVCVCVCVCARVCAQICVYRLLMCGYVQMVLIFKFYCILLCYVILMLLTACNANSMVMGCGCILRVRLLWTDLHLFIYSDTYFYAVAGKNDMCCQEGVCHVLPFSFVSATLSLSLFISVFLCLCLSVCLSLSLSLFVCLSRHVRMCAYCICLSVCTCGWL